MLRIIALPITAFAAFASSTAAAAQDSSFTDLAAIDAEIVAFTGAGTGTPGGARHPVDRRLRLARCEGPLALSWYGRAASMVQVECPIGSGWRIFVPVNAATGAGPARGPSSTPVTVVERGQVLTVTVAGSGFSVSQQGEALEDGAIGAWIRIRPEGSRETLRARIETPQRAVIPL